MCVICLLWEKDRLTTFEAFKATQEMVTDEHIEELRLRLHERMLDEVDASYD